VDVVEGVPQGKGLDLLQSGPVQGYDVSITGANDYEPTANSDIAIITAGFPRKPGMSRDDLLMANFDVIKTATEQVAANSFDIAIMIIGINDRQTIKTEAGSLKALTPEWNTLYQERVAGFVNAVRGANKPLIWIGLPPMSKSEFSTAMGQITAIQRLASFAGGAEFLDIYDRFVNDEGKYTSYGPDLNGAQVKMRKDDGIHFSSAGADKLAFYLSQSIKLFYRGGGAVGIEVADALAGTDAGLMVRPPYQGLGQVRLLEVAGAVVPLSATPRRASDLVVAGAVAVAATPTASFDMEMLVAAPPGRADSFGISQLPSGP
jgi:lysophospholipase L1-like esterase